MLELKPSHNASNSNHQDTSTNLAAEETIQLAKDISNRPRPFIRYLLAGILSLCLSLLLAVMGAAGASLFIIREGSGLDGLIDTLEYGLLGAITGLVLALIIAWRVSVSTLVKATAVAVICAGLTLCLISWRMAEQERVLSRKGPSYPPPTGQTWTMLSTLPDEHPQRSYQELEIDAKTWTFRYVTADPETLSCQGQLETGEATQLVHLAEILDHQLTDMSAELCASATTAPNATLSYRLTSSTAFTEIKATRACQSNLPGLAKILAILARVPVNAANNHRAHCEPH